MFTGLSVAASAPSFFKPIENLVNPKYKLRRDYTRIRNPKTIAASGLPGPGWQALIPYHISSIQVSFQSIYLTTAYTAKHGAVNLCVCSGLFFANLL